MKGGKGIGKVEARENYPKAAADANDTKAAAVLDPAASEGLRDERG